jgi:D-arabinose 5-phosphate isomerase GutQ
MSGKILCVSLVFVCTLACTEDGSQTLSLGTDADHDLVGQLAYIDALLADALAGRISSMTALAGVCRRAWAVPAGLT